MTLYYNWDFITLNRRWKYLYAIPVIYILITVWVNTIGEKKDLVIPVENASSKNWDKSSYWFYPWGNSGVHKGIDIFAKQKTNIISPIDGVIIDAGYSENGGNYLYIITSGLRIYYFAHLNSPQETTFTYVKVGQKIGKVGNSGNAVSTPYHLHFSVFSIFPIIKNYENKQPQGWKKMFYLDPRKLIIF